ncbi:dnaJ-like protein, partial [Trifolium medium]|nr:dnaJ-like protein [Trifolium medium]
MDCNKEEALRAKCIAEKKMESKDFIGARTIALKAQKLYPDLENIAQMLVVCDVHCSAEQKLLGNTKVVDWYKVLQVDRNDNDVIIKKQYRKFALQLHPDKNKFAGAEAAFKLIGEAQRVLLDREKRSSLNMSLSSFSMNRTAMPSHHQRNVPVNFNTVMQTNVRPVFPNLNPQQQQQSRQPTQQGVNGGVQSPTFWTMCSFCSVKFEYYRAVLNRSLRCQQCNKPFIAYEMDPQSTKPATNSSQNRQPTQQNNTPNHGAFKFGVGSQSNVFAKRPKKESHHKKGSTSNVAVKPNGKRKRKNVVESSESSIGSTDSEDDTLSNDNGFSGVPTSRDERPRRSTRQKHQVSYRENGSDDDAELKQPLKQGKESGSPYSDGENNEETEMNDQNGLAAGLKDGKKEAKKKQKIYSEESSGNIDVKIKEVGGKETVGSSKIDEASEQSDHSDGFVDGFVYPDPEFSDFDKDKKEECFASGQIWAVYDDIDAMPRFYAIIKKVFSPGFKLQITWLEADPNDKDECNWIEEKLPNACGKYKLGKTVTTKDQPMFSHQTLCEKIGRTTFKVYPRKGETWALFKNWDIKWYMDAKSHQKYDFEFVEILSDYVEGAGVIVAYLAKLKGFVSLYSRITEGRNCSFQIPPAELFRFSHRVPSFKMTGKEKAGVPVGSYELDPISLPMEEFAATDDVEVKVESTAKVNLDRSNLVEKKKDPVDHIDDVSAPSASVADSFEVPDPSFYQFDDERSHEKFEAGQIWAFYGDEDELPKYYGQIKEVRRIDSTIELQVIYLTGCWRLPEKIVRWDDEDMIISCGRFKVKPNGKLCTYHNTNSISHQVHASVVGKNKYYEIYPRVGEIWALYRGWTTKLKRSDLKNCEYDIVEVTEEVDSWIDVSFLEK